MSNFFFKFNILNLLHNSFFLQIPIKKVLEMYCTELIIKYKYICSYIFIKK